MKRHTAGQKKLSLLHTERRGTPHTCWTWRSFVPSTCQRANRPVAGSWMWMCSFRRLAHCLLLLSCPLWCHSLSFLSTPPRAQGASAKPRLLPHWQVCWAAEERTGRTCSMILGRSRTLLSREQDIYVIVMRYSWTARNARKPSHTWKVYIYVVKVYFIKTKWMNKGCENIMEITWNYATN